MTPAVRMRDECGAAWCASLCVGLKSSKRYKKLFEDFFVFAFSSIFGDWYHTRSLSLSFIRLPSYEALHSFPCS